MTKAEILALYESGLSSCAIAKQVGIPQSTIASRIASWRKMRSRSEAMTGRQFSDEHKKNISLSKREEKHPNWGKKRPAHSRNMTAEKNPNWKGGRYLGRGGVFISVLGRPDTHKNAVLEHRLVVEKAIGRYLKRGEVVHHVNGNKQDNRPSNLILCDQKYHAWIHSRMSELYMQEHFGGQR